MLSTKPPIGVHCGELEPQMSKEWCVMMRLKYVLVI